MGYPTYQDYSCGELELQVHLKPLPCEDKEYGLLNISVQMN